MWLSFSLTQTGVALERCWPARIASILLGLWHHFGWGIDISATATTSTDHVEGDGSAKCKVGRHSVNKVYTGFLGEGPTVLGLRQSWLEGMDVLKCGEAVCGVSRLGRVLW